MEWYSSRYLENRHLNLPSTLSITDILLFSLRPADQQNLSLYLLTVYPVTLLNRVSIALSFILPIACVQE